MKKIFLSMAAVAMLATVLVSCGETKDAKANDTATEQPKDGGTTTPPPADQTTTPPPATTGDAPTFSSDEVNKGLAEYKQLLADYTSALSSKDQAKITELGTKYSTWAQGAATWATKLKPDEAQKFSEYMQKLATEWAAAAQNAVK